MFSSNAFAPVCPGAATAAVNVLTPEPPIAQQSGTPPAPAVSKLGLIDRFGLPPGDVVDVGTTGSVVGGTVGDGGTVVVGGGTVVVVATTGVATMVKSSVTIVPTP